MLHLSTIDTTTLELLKSLMLHKDFSNLRLVGGTALALQIGHRKSIDLDLFGEIQFENLDNPETFKNYGEIITLSKSKNINIFSIDGIKVDFVNYSYPWLQNHLNNDGIRLAHIEDIAAMKLAVVTGRGSRKDFIDLFFLMQKYSLSEMLGFYKRKYFDGSEYLLLKSLTYFDDAENDIQVTDILKTPWGTIKSHIQKAVAGYLDKT